MYTYDMFCSYDIVYTFDAVVFYTNFQYKYIICYYLWCKGIKPMTQWYV
eukprot:SAG11_NODE_26103_length_349_cov_3.740000_2_plen_48_part_01